MEDFCKYESCPICGSKNIKNKFKNISGINNVSDVFDMFHCKDCNAYFIGQKLTPEYIEKYYSIDCRNGLTYNDENLKNLNYYYINLKNKIEKMISQKGKILDIGCSGGYFLDVMDGWDRYGCEIEKAQADIAKSKYQEHIFCGDIKNYQMQDNFFDVITLQDCLDHMINPNEIINKCHKLLKQGGLLVIKAHNSDCLFAKMQGKKFYAIMPPEHLFLFNKKSITTLVSNNGFKLTNYTFMYHVLSLATIFLRLSKRSHDDIFFRIYKYLSSSVFQNICIYKDLHDIFTAFAKKI